MLTVLNLMKNTFNLGLCRCTDEAKVEFILAIKAFFVVFIGLHYYKFNTFFDVDLERAHEQVVARVNVVLALFKGNLKLPAEFTYSILASCAAILSFSLVRISIKFAYYFYVVSKNQIY